MLQGDGGDGSVTPGRPGSVKFDNDSKGCGNAVEYRFFHLSGKTALYVEEYKKVLLGIGNNDV